MLNRCPCPLGNFGNTLLDTKRHNTLWHGHNLLQYGHIFRPVVTYIVRYIHLYKSVLTHKTYHTRQNIWLHHSLRVNSMFTVCCIIVFKLTMLNYNYNCAHADVRHAPTPMLCWWMQEQISESGQDTLFLTEGMYLTGLSGLYDYDGHNANWQCHKVYFLSPSKVTQDVHKLFICQVCAYW